MVFWYLTLQSSNLNPSSSCKHYSRSGNRDHYISFLDDLYYLDYIEAYFNKDSEEVDWIEESASVLGYGPLVECTTVTNFSAQ
jgi:hypothetical protein